MRFPLMSVMGMILTMRQIETKSMLAIMTTIVTVAMLVMTIVAVMLLVAMAMVSMRTRVSISP